MTDEKPRLAYEQNLLDNPVWPLAPFRFLTSTSYAKELVRPLDLCYFRLVAVDT